MEHLIDELFAEVGYRCEEWLGAQNSRLGIFGNQKTPELKMIFGLELSRSILKCDLLLPVTVPLSCLTDETKLENRELN